MRLTCGNWWIWLCHICCLCSRFLRPRFSGLTSRVMVTAGFIHHGLECIEVALWTGKWGLFVGRWLSHIQFHASSVLLTQITSELDAILLYMKAVHGRSFCWVLPFYYQQDSVNFEQNGICSHEWEYEFPSKVCVSVRVSELCAKLLIAKLGMLGIPLLHVGHPRPWVLSSPLRDTSILEHVLSLNQCFLFHEVVGC